MEREFSVLLLRSKSYSHEVSVLQSPLVLRTKLREFSVNNSYVVVKEYTFTEKDIARINGKSYFFLNIRILNLESIVMNRNMILICLKL